jgi:hypothetical protein
MKRFVVTSMVLFVLIACSEKTTTPAPVTSPSPFPTEPAPTPNPDPAPVPSNARLSRAYKEVMDKHYANNPIQPGECSREIHDSYWVTGPDGKIYPTWHPPVDPKTGCAFGHEHGSDPSCSNLASIGLPFGYTNEKLFEYDSVNYRDEDHVGHKVEWVNNMEMGGDGRVKGTCDILLKFHQGTHSHDALTNNLHEVFYYADCSNGMAMQWRSLHGFGPPSEIFVNCTPYNGYVLKTGPAVPSNSPTDGGSRNLPDHNCLGLNRFNMQEDWPIDMDHTLEGGIVFGFGLYFQVGNASRYVDLSDPNGFTLRRPVDVCYGNTPAANMPECVELRKLGRVEWNDPRSPWNGTARRVHINQLTVHNPTSQTRWYTDPFGIQIASQPDPSKGIVVEQIISSGDFSDLGMFEGSPIIMDHDHPTVHSPN